MSSSTDPAAQTKIALFEDDEYLTPKDPRMRIFGEEQTLARQRHEGRGPPYVKFGSLVRYIGADLNEHARKHRVQTLEN